MNLDYDLTGSVNWSCSAMSGTLKITFKVNQTVGRVREVVEKYLAESYKNIKIVSIYPVPKNNKKSWVVSWIAQTRGKK